MSASGQSDADYLSEVRRAVLAAALPNVPFDGWSARTLQNAIDAAAVDPGLALLAFPDGVMDLLDNFWAQIDAALMREMAAQPPSAHLSQNITAALQIYIQLLRPHREASRRALALQALPFNAPKALACLYRTVDTIWRAVGDTSTDFNFYTKRASLAAVVASVVTHWLGGAGKDEALMHAFISGRIEDISRFEKFKARLVSVTKGLPSPGPLFGWLAARFPGSSHRG